MAVRTIFELVFTAGIVVASAALAAAAFRLAGRVVLGGATLLVAAMAVAAWIAFALQPGRDLAVSAGGLTGAAVAAAASLALGRALQRSSRIDAELEQAQARLHELVAREAEDRAAELERVLARARADSVSLLAEQERRIAEERRKAVVERENAAGAELLAALARTQRQVEQRLQDWGRDLERAAEAIRTRLIDLGQRQRQLTADAEARLGADADRLQAESDEQREALVRLRGELQRAMEEAVAAARNELDVQAADRRRALHELGERLRRRERELAETIERGEAEAVQRIQASLADVQRRQVEQLERAVARAGAGFSDEAALQFANLIKSAREDAARRLARELERAVGAFAREAEGVLAERLAHVGDAGAQRLERRLAQITSGLERQREEFVQAFQARLAEAEDDLRRRLSELAADAEAERAILEARLQELSRRIDEMAALRAG
jgi:golgin subfamily B member 1